MAANGYGWGEGQPAVGRAAVGPHPATLRPREPPDKDKDPPPMGDGSDNLLLRDRWNMEFHKNPTKAEEIAEQAKQEAKMEATIVKRHPDVAVRGAANAGLPRGRGHSLGGGEEGAAR